MTTSQTERPSVEEAIYGKRDEYGRPVYGSLPKIEMPCPLNGGHSPIIIGGTPPDAEILTFHPQCNCDYSQVMQSTLTDLARLVLQQAFVEKGITWETLKIPYPPGPPLEHVLRDALPRIHRRARLERNLKGRQAKVGLGSVTEYDPDDFKGRPEYRDRP